VVNRMFSSPSVTATSLEPLLVDSTPIHGRFVMRFTGSRRSHRFVPAVDSMEARLAPSEVVLVCPMDAMLITDRPTTPVLQNPMAPVLLTPPAPILVTSNPGR
jgi:hypothetical protein